MQRVRPRCQRINFARVVVIVLGVVLMGGRSQSLPTAQEPLQNTANIQRTQPGDSEWRSYGNDTGSSKYSPLSQINKDNIKDLKIAWIWHSADDEKTKGNPRLKTSAWEATPLMVNGVLYVSTSLSQVAALEAATGRTLWVYDPETWKNGTPPNQGFVSRGVAYWEKDRDKRVFIGTGDAYLLCLNAATGKPVPAFGKDGRIYLTQGLGRSVNRKYYGVSSPPIICRDTVVVGSNIVDFPIVKEMPPGDVRGFDVRTGKLKWTFHAAAQKGEFGAETWEDNSNSVTGSANVWSLMSADEKLGYLYLPFTSPSNDFYGGERHGNGLFGDSLVCVDARTGKRIWHFQMVHHDLWDYDLPAAPNLMDITVNGKKIKAVAQVSKQGFCYVFDRVTGKPVWPIEERAVPQSTVPGEKSSPTQPFPTKPAPFDRQGFSEAELMDFTPELHEEAQKILEKYHYGPLFTPPSLDKPIISMPGVAGGASWAGAAADPETGMLYIPSNTIPFGIMMTKAPVPHTKYVGGFIPMETVQGLPLQKPPYSRVTAIDLNTGEQKWMKPMGRFPSLEDNPFIKSLHLAPTGRPSRGHILLTKTLLFIAQEGTTLRISPAQDGLANVADFGIVDPKLCAYDKTTGAVVGEVALPRNATGAPMTYSVRGKQFIVIPTGGANLPAELIALSLP